jgi:hypothetical protein
LALVRALDLEGYSEVEFRRDASGRPLLMEINARLSGSLEVAVRSGVPFPALLWQWASGEPLSPVSGYRTGVKMRYLKGDVKWLWENIESRGRRPDCLPPRKATSFLRSPPWPETWASPSRGFRRAQPRTLPDARIRIEHKEGQRCPTLRLW